MKTELNVGEIIALTLISFIFGIIAVGSVVGDDLCTHLKDKPGVVCQGKIYVLQKP